MMSNEEFQALGQLVNKAVQSGAYNINEVEMLLVLLKKIPVDGIKPTQKGAEAKRPEAKKTVAETN